MSRNYFKSISVIRMTEKKSFLFVCTLMYITIIRSQAIESKVACEWQALTLECPRGHLLNIVSANYGRTSSAVCALQGNTNCRAPNSFNIVQQNCNKQPSCTLMARNDVFGDPCEGTVKYLEVQYQCIAAPPCGHDQFKCDNGQCISKTSVCNGIKECPSGEDESGCNYQTAYGCERGTLNVACKKDELIRVVHGDYGRSNPAICHWDEKVNCHSPVANNILKERCDLKRSCQVPASNDVFGDPCHGTYKYAELHYTCWKIPLR